MNVYFTTIFLYLSIFLGFLINFIPKYYHFHFLYAISIPHFTFHIKEYFSFQIYHQKSLHAIYSLYPHGYLPFVSLCLLPKNHVVLNTLYSVPIVKQVLKNHHCIPNLYETMKKTLQKESIYMYPGGLEEAKYFHKDVHFIKKRKGMFQLSKELQVPIVPVYVKNQNKLYENYLIFPVGRFILFPKKVPLSLHYGNPVFTKEEYMKEVKRLTPHFSIK